MVMILNSTNTVLPDCPFQTDMTPYREIMETQHRTLDTPTPQPSPRVILFPKYQRQSPNTVLD
jgi:hypothetical protein